MTITFFDFISNCLTSFPFLVTALITTGVIMVNGWTDAANAIATCVSTRSIAPKAAIVMSAICNFAGVFLMSMVNASVASTISNMVNFSSGSSDSLICLCAGLTAIVVWATGASVLGLNTSESHALVAGITGAAIALQGDLSAVNFGEWVKVLYGIILSSVLGFAIGWLIVKTVEMIFRNIDRRKTGGIFQGAQIAGAAAMSFMHGAQDGQKFMGIFMLGLSLANGSSTTEFIIPVWLMIYCSIIMALGTSIGGYNIIKSVGMDMVKLEKYQGFSADLGGATALFILSLLGMPVSTTHTKTTSIMGVGAAKRLSAVNWGVVGEMVTAWLLTFPGCGAIGFGMAKLFMLIF